MFMHKFLQVPLNFVVVELALGGSYKTDVLASENHEPRFSCILI